MRKARDMLVLQHSEIGSRKVISPNGGSKADVLNGSGCDHISTNYKGKTSLAGAKKINTATPMF